MYKFGYIFIRIFNNNLFVFFLLIFPLFLPLFLVRIENIALCRISFRFDFRKLLMEYHHVYVGADH